MAVTAGLALIAVSVTPSDGSLGAFLPAAASTGPHATRDVPHGRRGAATDDSESGSSRRSRLLAAAAAAVAVAPLTIASRGARAKVVDKTMYSSQEGAGLAGQSNKDVAKYADFGQGLKVAKLEAPKFAEGDPDASRTVKAGDTVTLDLIGYLAGYNGLIFVRTQDKSGFSEFPVTFKVGAGVAIPGLDRGVVGMVKGEKRRIVIPASLGYPRPLKEEDLGKPGTIPNPMESTSVNGAPWELRNRLLNGVLNNSQRDDTLVIDCKLKRVA